MEYIWVSTAFACYDCGGDAAVMATEEQPTDEQVEQLEDSIGGMACIKTMTCRTVIGGGPATGYFRSH